MMENQKTKTIRAVIFDWAGTVVDFGCFAPIYGLVEAFQAFGVDVSLDAARRDMGLAKRDHIRKLLSLQSVEEAFRTAHGRSSTESDIDKIHEHLETGLLSRLRDFAAPIDGVVDMVDKLTSAGIQVGSTTGYTRPMMDVILPIAMEAGYRPQAVVTPSEVPTGRPAPWMCYENAKRLGIYPMDRLVKVGDTLVDIDEGRNAGMWTVGVIEGSNLLGLSQSDVMTMPQSDLILRKKHVRQQMVHRGADLVIDRIVDLPDAILSIEQALDIGGRPGEGQRELAQA
ncbi:phosphonoacetaldehyde hydrolase [Alicyclobacillus fastidiosus]|uniref:Phosphonoacetaldehyde hydrolase n=1 Tax=Alicyclobacillus fastidiosus TaxID=392011 RepID=A0ABY6ZCY2_9BACL|nr:phosphonoacetaldehyde hydrolase [Alicyclobacillus fastidiosus]WAH39980.1 phosphonoacetaldehyde hydrolase [Alicyclobacillus fastidiosus]GMA61269.1 phosphonoacetaldehyde hydrolase [Alicyclobacillus fastidiosus]